LFTPTRGFSLRRTGLLAADVVTITLAILLSSLLRLGTIQGLEYCAEHAPTVLGSTAVFLVVFYASGMYERIALTRKEGSYALPLISVSIGLALVILIFYARYQLGIGRGILSMAGVFIFLGSWAVRYVYRMAVGRGLLSKKALVVGDGRELDNVIRLIQRTPDAGLKLVGCATPTRMAAGTYLQGVPVLGTIERLRETVDSFDIETIVVASSLSREPSLLRTLRPLRWGGIEVMDYVMLHEMLAQDIPLDHVNDEWLMNAAMNSSVIHIRQIKRIMDVSVAFVGLVVSMPIWVAAAIAVRLDSTAALRSGRPHLHPDEVSHDAPGCRGPVRCRLGRPERRPRHPGWTLVPEVARGRDSPARQRAPRRYEPGRPAPRTPRIRRNPRPGHSLLQGASARTARHHGLGPGEIPLRGQHRGGPAQTAVRPLLHQAHGLFPRLPDPAAHVQDHRDRSRAQRGRAARG
jgi:hypothetical protein